jgi:hypothetical protein
VKDRAEVVIVISRQHAKTLRFNMAFASMFIVSDPIEEAAPRLDGLRAQLEAAKAAEKIPPAKRQHWDRRAKWGKPWR